VNSRYFIDQNSGENDSGAGQFPAVFSRGCGYKQGSEEELGRRAQHSTLPRSVVVLSVGPQGVPDKLSDLPDLSSPVPALRNGFAGIATVLERVLVSTGRI
jgi:hypothetical protein